MSAKVRPITANFLTENKKPYVHEKCIIKEVKTPKLRPFSAKPLQKNDKLKEASILPRDLS